MDGTRRETTSDREEIDPKSSGDRCVQTERCKVEECHHPGEDGEKGTSNSNEFSDGVELEIFGWVGAVSV